MDPITPLKMKILNLKNLAEENSFNSMFNTLHKNFLRYEFNASEILSVSNFLKDEYKNLLDCNCDSVNDDGKLFIGRNEEGFFEIKVFEKSSKNQKPLPEDIKLIYCSAIINKNKISKKNLLSFVVWEYYKEKIREKKK